MQLALVEYFKNLQKDLDTPIPQELSEMSVTSLAFEVGKLFEYITKTQDASDLYIINIPDMKKVEELVNNPDKSLSVSALVTIIDHRMPRLEIAKRL